MPASALLPSIVSLHNRLYQAKVLISLHCPICPALQWVEHSLVECQNRTIRQVLWSTLRLQWCWYGESIYQFLLFALKIFIVTIQIIVLIGFYCPIWAVFLPYFYIQLKQSRSNALSPSFKQIHLSVGVGYCHPIMPIYATLNIRLKILCAWINLYTHSSYYSYQNRHVPNQHLDLLLFSPHLSLFLAILWKILYQPLPWLHHLLSLNRTSIFFLYGTYLFSPWLIILSLFLDWFSSLLFSTTGWFVNAITRCFLNQL